MIVSCVLENYFAEDNIGIIPEVGHKMPQAYLKLLYLFILLSINPIGLDIMVKLKQLHCFVGGYSGQWTMRSFSGKMLRFSPSSLHYSQIPGC